MNYKKYKKSSEAKTLLANFLSLSILQVASYVFPLFTLPYLARVIGTDGFGKIAFAGSVISWIQTIADWGFTYSATRDVAQNRNDKEKVSEIFSEVLWARCFLVIVSFLILITLICSISYFRENTFIILITFLTIPGHLCFPDWFFQAIERMKFITYFNLIIRVLFSCGVFLFIKHESDYWLQPLLMSLGSLLCGLISLYLIVLKWQYKLYKPKFNKIVLCIKNSTDIFVSNIVPSFYNNLSVVFLGAYGGAIANGIYEGGNKIITVANQFLSIISRVFFPYLSRYPNKHSTYAKINIILAAIVAIFLFFCSSLVVEIILADGFKESAVVLKILAISYFFLALDNSYGTNYLIVVHKEKTLRNITFLASFIGLIISWPLITTYSYIGAALTVCVSRVLLGSLVYVYAKKYNIESL